MATMTTLMGLTIKVGDDYSKTFPAFTDADGVAINITGATLTFHLRAPGATTDALTATLALTTPASGIATLTLTDTQTATLTAGLTYRYEIEMVDSGGLITTPIEGLALATEDWG